MTDYLKIARFSYESARYEPDANIQYTQAVALIAIAEELRKINERAAYRRTG